MLDHLTHPFLCFSMNKPNRFRMVIQVIDLITMDLDYAFFSNSRLALSVVLISILISYGIVLLPIYSPECHTHAISRAQVELDR